MKILAFILLAIMLIGIAGTATAKGPKSTILHCGCVYDDIDGAGMAYKDINVSARTRGHDGHVAGTVDSCYDGQVEVDEGVFEDVFTDFVRNGDDCQLDGPPLGDPIDACPDDPAPLAGDLCGIEVLF